MAVSAATSRELADEYCYHTRAAWCLDADGDGVRESAPQLHPRFTEEGIEHLRERGRYYDPNDVGPTPTPGPTNTPTPTPTPTPTATPAPAQSAVSASNLDETSGVSFLRIGDLGGTNVQRANAFTTGPRSGGYTLASVSASFAGQVGSLSNITVEVHAVSGGNPGDLVTTLAGSNPTTAGTHTYTCSSSCALSASTDYFLVISVPNAPGGAGYNTYFTTSDNEALVPPGNGWSLANTAKFKAGTSAWADLSGGISLKFKITAN